MWELSSDFQFIYLSSKVIVSLSIFCCKFFVVVRIRFYLLTYLLSYLLKLHNTSITPKMVKKVILNLDSSKPSCPNCIPVVVLRNCESELSCMLAELFNICLKESCFPDWWKVSSVLPVFKNVGERSTAKNCNLVSLFSVVSKFFEKLVIGLLIT